MQPLTNQKVFRFNSFWLDYLGCHEADQKAWNFSPHGNPMQPFSHFLSQSLFQIRGWSRYGVNSIESEILKVESNIHSFLNSDLDPNSQYSLTNLYSKLEALQRQSNSRWAQRAHMLWLMNGDKNFKFFHYITQSLTHFNSIT